MNAAAVQSAPQPTEFGQAVNGAVSMAGALAVTQPLFLVKTLQQSNSTAPLRERMGNIILRNPATGAPERVPQVHRLWAGYTPNAASGAIAEAIAFATREVGVRALQPTNGQISDSQNFALSFGCGVLGAPVNASLERGMILQQLETERRLMNAAHNGPQANPQGNNGFMHHMRDIYRSEGIRGVFKGTAVTAVRDSWYNAGVFAMTDVAKRALTPYISDPTQRDLTAGMAAGMAAGAASNSSDLVKTRMQEDRSGKYRTAMQTTATIVREEGAKALLKGTIGRAFTIGPLIAAMSVVKDRIPNYLPSWLLESRK